MKIVSGAPLRQVVMMGFSMGGYVAAAFAAAHPELLAGVLMGACCHDAHTLTWQLMGRMAELVYKMCSDRTKAQVGDVLEDSTAAPSQAAADCSRPSAAAKLLGGSQHQFVVERCTALVVTLYWWPPAA